MRKKPTPHDELLDLKSARIVAGLGQSMKGHAERTRRAIVAENKSLDKRLYFRSINEAYQCGGFSTNIVRPSVMASVIILKAGASTTPPNKREKNMSLTIKDPMSRGGLASDDVQAAYEKATGRVLTVAEGRLLVYLRYSACNGGYIDTRRMTKPERQTVEDMCAAGLMTRDANYKIGLTPVLFEQINAIEWDVYCTRAEAAVPAEPEPSVTGNEAADE